MKIYQRSVKFFTFIWLLVMTPAIFAMENAHFASDTYRQNIADFYQLPSAKNLTLLKVTGYQQTLDYTCGPAAVMSLMHYYGLLTDAKMNEETEKRIAKEMGTNDINGTSPQQMIRWLKKNGFEVTYGKGGTMQLLQDNLKKGIPTLIEWIDWGGHWVVVMGYHKDGNPSKYDKDTLFLADPSVHFQNVKYMDGISTFNADRLNSMWFDAQYFNPGHLVRGIYITATPKNIREVHQRN